MCTLNNLSRRTAVWCASMALTACISAAAHAQGKYPGIGRVATPAEVAAWDIDVRPDFQGLPRGQGTVDAGADIWDRACASCHGAFGESNEVFTPIVGGTTVDDVASGRVAALRQGANQPQRTSLMKVSTVSTLWDYIYRAMPWDAPKSLSPDEVYAVVAYILNLGEIVPADFTLSNQNIAEVQARMPNRDGMTLAHGLWRVNGTPDTTNTACMRDCRDTVEISSVLPDYARNAHGDIAAQNRVIGPVRGVNTLADPLSGTVADNAEAVRAHAWTTVTQAAGGARSDLTAGLRLVSATTCVACHAVDRKLVGPAYREIADKYQGQTDARTLLSDKIRHGGSGVWGTIPMPPNPTMSDADLETMVGWILSGAPTQ